MLCYSTGNVMILKLRRVLFSSVPVDFTVVENLFDLFCNS